MHVIDIEAKWGMLGSIMKWCEINCNDQWRIGNEYTDEDNGLHYLFHFEDEQDAVAFILRWK